MSTAQDLPLGEDALAYGEPAAQPALRLVPSSPLDFDAAVRQLRPRLNRYAVRRLGDVHEAEELVQEALLRAYTHREQLRTEEDLSAWTTVVTGRLVIDRLRVRGRSTTMADVPEGSRVGRDTAEVVVARDEARTALDALDAMPARQAALLWAREVEGRSYEELCERFDMTEPAVRSVLTRARKSLRKEYALRGGTLPVGGLAILAPWIAGLTIAEKVRQVATRVTAPAALAAVGITALGGLILSPFGLAPGPSPSTYRPSQAIVTSAQHVTPVAAKPAVPAGSTSSTSTRLSGAVPVAAEPRGAVGKVMHDRLGHVCTEGTDNGAGSTTCAPQMPSSWVYVPLPTAVAGQREVGVSVGINQGPRPLSCADVPQTSVLACKSQGAPQ